MENRYRSLISISSRPCNINATLGIWSVDILSHWDIMNVHIQPTSCRRVRKAHRHLVRKAVTYDGVSKSSSELRPMAHSPSARYRSRVVHDGNHQRPCLQLFRDTTLVLVSPV